MNGGKWNVASQPPDERPHRVENLLQSRARCAAADRRPASDASPHELWQRCFSERNDWRDRFGAVPFEDGGGKRQLRHYQHNATTAVLEAIARGRERMLLTLATGAGKTSIAFQIAWKLFRASWNLSREPARRPRILFLADRNILADQAWNAFSAFTASAARRWSRTARV